MFLPPGLVSYLCLTLSLDVRLVTTPYGKRGGGPVIYLPNVVRLKPLPTDDPCAVGLFSLAAEAEVSI